MYYTIISIRSPQNSIGNYEGPYLRPHQSLEKPAGGNSHSSVRVSAAREGSFLNGARVPFRGTLRVPFRDL